jgi:lipopolysaccharide export system permease protein
MKTLHLYLTRQVVASLVLTVAVFTFVLLLGNLFREIMELLVNRQASLLVVLEALAYLIPFVLVFALPMGLLTATLLVFGRFSADQELTAARASGVSLLSLITPILLLSVVLSGMSAWFNMQLGPLCRVKYKDLFRRLGAEQPAMLIQPNQYIRFRDYTIYIRKKDGNELRDVIVYQMETNAAPTLTNAVVLPRGTTNIPKVAAIFTAPRATLTVDTTNNVLGLEPEVEATHVETWQPGRFTDYVLQIPVDFSRAALRKPTLSDMTMRQLFEEYYEYKRVGLEVTPVAVQMHRQVAFSFACIGFTLVGIPLAVRAHRRETSAGVGIALLLVLVYHSFTIMAQAWETEPGRHPQLIVWVPNFLFQAVGCWLLWRANRRG